MTLITEPTPEQVAYRTLLASFKAAIKDDATSLRAEKRERAALHDDLHAAAQSRLHYHRLEARARLIIYGYLRGRTLAQIESGRTEIPSHVVGTIAQVWKKFMRANTESTGLHVEFPAALLAAMPEATRVLFK